MGTLNRCVISLLTQLFGVLAEEVRFELTVPLPVRQFSRRSFTFNHSMLQQVITRNVKALGHSLFCGDSNYIAVICR